MSVGLDNPFPFHGQINVTNWGICSLGFVGSLGAMSSQTWPAANRAIFIPFRFPWPFRCSGFGIVNGGTVSGNVDVGIYAPDGTRLASSGSVAQSGAGGFQFFSFGGTRRFEVGLYYAALAFSSGTATISGTAAFGVARTRILGLAQMASAFPLPASATFAEISSPTLPGVMLGVSAMLQFVQPVEQFLPAMPHIFPWTLESGGVEIVSRNGTHLINLTSGTAWPTANKAILITFAVFRRTRFQRLFLLNGGTASGNFDIGVYDHSLRKIVSSGSTAQSGTNVIQSVNIDVTLGPGNYYLALAMNNTTGTVFRGILDSSAQLGANNSLYRAVTSSFPLPDTLSAPNDFSVFIPLMGISQRTVI